MSKKNKIVLDDYNNWVHKFGRIGGIVIILYMLSIPMILSIVYDAMPTMSVVLKGSVGIVVLFTPIGISEIVSYTPILGSASYLTFITGNVLNLKLPCVLNAFKISNTEQNTPEGDAMATIAVASSSILTMVIIALGIILLVPLQPILQKPFIQKATMYMLPALFGGMFLGILGPGTGEKKVENKFLMIIVPIILVTIATISGVLVSGMEGIAIITMIPITILSARILWKKGIIKVVEREK